MNRKFSEHSCKTIKSRKFSVTFSVVNLKWAKMVIKMLIDLDSCSKIVQYFIFLSKIIVEDLESVDRKK